MGLVTHEATSAREIKRGSRATGDIGEVAVLGAKKRTRTIAETERKGDTANTEWRSAKGEKKGVVAKSNLDMLVEEPACEEKISAKEDTLAREGVMVTHQLN